MSDDCESKREVCRREIRESFAAVEKRLDRKHDQILILIGADGKNGKFGDLCEDVSALQAKDKKRDEAKVSLATKIIIAAVTVPTVGGGTTYLVISRLAALFGG